MIDGPRKLLNLLGERLPGDLAFQFSADTSIIAGHRLQGEINAMLAGEVASLPYKRTNDVLWVTVAPHSDGLRQAIEDLRCWLLPSYGWEANPAVVTTAAGRGELGSLLLQQSPHGYFRWFSRSSELDRVVDRLAVMRDVISRAPKRETRLRPTLETLRRQFALGLATWDRDLALDAVDAIDQRQLDTAPNSLSMRIRLAAAFGDDLGIVTNPRLDDLLSTRVSARVVQAVLRAHHSVFIAEPETRGDFEGALAAYAGIADRLAGLAASLLEGSDPQIVAMAAYDAAYEDDAAGLRTLAARFPDSAVAAALSSRFREPVAAEVALESSPTIVVEEPVSNLAEGDAPTATKPGEQAGPESWEDVPTTLAAGSRKALQVFLEQVALDPDRFEPRSADFVVEIFTDVEVTADPVRSADAEQILTALIDAYVSEERFPRRERLGLYQAILEIWTSTRAQSSDPIDGHLLLTLADAMLRLDGKLEGVVATAITDWWRARPVRSNLPWLGEALELLTDHSRSQDALTLWYDGVQLVRDDPEALSISDQYLFRRLGRRLGLEEDAVDTALGGHLTADEVSSDPLSACVFEKIAIVSLAERSAREAAKEIQSRTSANVIVVTDYAAGEGTASAATADVILFVWGATKHAVYRAFDKVRDRLEYVQGTGSASIVRALERRAGLQSN
jgi:hypothetical protein